jgi:hypothetical protein
VNDQSQVYIDINFMSQICIITAIVLQIEVIKTKLSSGVTEQVTHHKEIVHNLCSFE